MKINYKGRLDNVVIVANENCGKSTGCGAFNCSTEFKNYIIHKSAGFGTWNGNGNGLNIEEFIGDKGQVVTNEEPFDP